MPEKMFLSCNKVVFRDSKIGRHALPAVLFSEDAIPRQSLRESNGSYRTGSLESRLGRALALHDGADILGGFVQVEGHTLGAEVLADNVELDAVLVDHVGHAAKIVSSNLTM